MIPGPNTEHFLAIRQVLAATPADVSSDVEGIRAAQLEELFAPHAHAAALDSTAPIVLGARGVGKSFWASALRNPDLRRATAIAYPRLALDRLDVQVGFSGQPGPRGIDREQLDAVVPLDADEARARAFWWATVLRALGLSSARAEHEGLSALCELASNHERRNQIITSHELEFQQRGAPLLVIYDALDTVATSWPRRRLLTQALLEVVWSMRAWRWVRPKLFMRPDQLEDDALRHIELPKLRTGAVRLTWSGSDLYGLLFARLALGEAAEPFHHVLESQGMRGASREEILARIWTPAHDVASQRRIMTVLAGAYMAGGTHGYKKGKTYDWPLRHLGDAYGEITPRSFLGLLTGASRQGQPPVDRAITPEGMRHGLRVSSKIRVDQLYQEFPWIKGMLAPLAGILLPKPDVDVFEVWARAGTVAQALEDAAEHGYLSPFPRTSPSERDCYEAMARIGVMTRRKDGCLDMPDLFRVAAKLLKKGGTSLR